MNRHKLSQKKETSSSPKVTARLSLLSLFLMTLLHSPHFLPKSLSISFYCNTINRDNNGKKSDVWRERELVVVVSTVSCTTGAAGYHREERKKSNKKKKMTRKCTAIHLMNIPKAKKHNLPR
uniref:Uncharacterized protein n=1 Tax=Trypanosoma congolense (strain IL3000) TaxID=1068625 RepID=G0UUS7_TRYCI|nr:hypothetical protein, unlikely [Trypanosoma congolense IL3000]